MGGQAAEENVYDGVTSTGAGDDLQRASELVRQMVMRFGMSQRLERLTYGAPQSAEFLRFPFVSEERNYSEYGQLYRFRRIALRARLLICPPQRLARLGAKCSSIRNRLSPRAQTHRCR